MINMWNPSCLVGKRLISGNAPSTMATAPTR
jgi:hypothetical protein